MFGQKVKIGIAFGGGGTRGFTHLGAIKAFEEFGLKFDFIAGTSAGSLVGAFYACGYTYKQMYDIVKTIKEIATNKSARYTNTALNESFIIKPRISTKGFLYMIKSLHWRKILSAWNFSEEKTTLKISPLLYINKLKE